MPRYILLDSFPVSCLGKIPGALQSMTDQCQRWVLDCVVAGNRVIIPAISYYETLRELERLGAKSQISRIKAFCFAEADRFHPLTTAHLELAAQLWGRARNTGTPTAAPEALDGDVILAAQALSLGVPTSELVVATTNSAHISRFVPSDLWSNIVP